MKRIIKWILLSILILLIALSAVLLYFEVPQYASAVNQELLDNPNKYAPKDSLSLTDTTVFPEFIYLNK